MEIITEEYSIKYDVETATITWQGIMRLNGKEYDPITKLLNDVMAAEPAKITFNLQKLKALNSSGITMLGRFVFGVKKKKNIELLMQGAKNIAWQKKSVKNFQRLMPTLQFEWE